LASDEASVNRAFTFFVSADVMVGTGQAQQLAEELLKRSWIRLGLVVDAGIIGTTAWQEVERRLRAACHIDARFECNALEPTYDYLDQAKEVFLGRPLDAMVVAGGGSTLDLGKAIAVLTTNPGPASQYRGFNLIKNPGPPVIAIPTTAGTGSEVTPNTVFTHAGEKRKFGIITRLCVPRLVVLDPALTITCPRGATLASGLDALVQAIENYASNKATPLSRPFSREAIARTFAALPDVMRDPSDLAGRAEMQMGAFLSGIGLTNGGGGIAGALSYPLGTHFNVPHGLAHAVFTPAVVRWNAARGTEVYAHLYDAIDGCEPGLSPLEKSRRFGLRLEDLFAEVGAPVTLRALGLSERDVESLKTTISTQPPVAAFEQNPVAFSAANLLPLIDSVA